MTENNLLAELKQAVAPKPSPGFRPGITFAGRRPAEIRTPPLDEISENDYEQTLRDMGYPIPEDMTVVLVEMELVEYESFWKRDPEDKGQKDSAYTAPSRRWRYRFKVVPKNHHLDEDIAALMAEAKAAPPAPRRKPTASKVSKIVCLSDPQWGKVDALGGTKATLARSEEALRIVKQDIIDMPVDEIILVDTGDILEGTESAPNALGTNDLNTTQQVRIARRVMWRWVEALAPLAPAMSVISVPSNHCRVRRGKAPLGDSHDDWGLEILSQIADIARGNPKAYGHIEFIIPEAHQEHVLITLAAGKVLGVAHGHQKGSASALTTWIKSTGRNGLAQADIVIVGHFHHLVIEAFGDRQWLFVCPTLDNGSSWFTPSSGERSDPGILTMSVDKRGWFGMDPIWLTPEG